MLIDYTYFFGHCEVGQLSSQVQGVYPVRDKLNWLINQYEPKYLESLLGYAAYKQLMADLLLDPVPVRWTELLYGAEYTDIRGLLQKWKGLIRLPSGNVSIIAGPDQIDIVVGRGGTYDPVADSVTTTIPAGLVGQAFTFHQRGYGPLRDPNSASPEYSISGSTLTLLNGLVFSSEDTYFYFGDSVLITTDDADSLFKESPIAYYVYYWYQRNLATNSGGAGESKTEFQNASAASASQKMVTAWNKMVVMNHELHDFLYAEKLTYPEWYAWYPYYPYRGIFRSYGKNTLYTPINTMSF